MKKIYIKCIKKIIVFLLWAVVAVFFAIAIPIAINYAFTRPAWSSLFAVAWEAKDALDFYGSILGAGAAIFVLRITIIFTRENQREERKLSVKPYLQTNVELIEGLKNNLKEKSLTFLEMRNGIVESQNSLPDELNTLFVLSDRAAKQASNPSSRYGYLFAKETTAYFKSNLLLMYEIKNCGAGNAISVKFEMNGFKSYPAFCITTNDPKRFVLILNDELIEDKVKNIKLSFTYSDVCSLGVYTQEESINFFRDKEGVLSFSQLSENLLTAPEEITEKK